MNCPACSTPLSTRRGDYQYLESGLPNVTLLDIELLTCDDCDEEMASIPRLEELHRVLAFAIATHPARLVGTEIRFLRKYLGWSGKDFAATMGVQPETVSRWENDRERIGLVSDRLLRTMVLRLRPVDEYPTENLSTLGTEDGPGPALGLTIDGGQWHPCPKAA
jgi:putative zinc finger/helix-turn-helix YgiT family protein